MERKTEKFLDPATLMRIKSMQWRAKTVVEGLWNGLHRSPYHGFSVEFTEYRQYTPGDDLRYLDWRLYARSDRFYVKRFEDETNVRCFFMLDMSRSMEYGSLSYNKSDYAKTLVASMAHFLSGQRDAVGMVTFEETVKEFLPARCRPGHLQRLMSILDRRGSGDRTDVSASLEEVAERVGRRGLFVLVSDLLAPLDGFADRLARLTACGHEVVVFQVLDPAELTFDFQGAELFRDAESGQEIYVDPQTARSGYLRKLSDHNERIQQTCDAQGAVLHRLSTDAPLEQALLEFLNDSKNRAGKGAGRGGVRGRRAA